MTNVEKSNDYKVYLIPSHHPNKMYTHFVVLYDDSNHIRPLGDVKMMAVLLFYYNRMVVMKFSLSGIIVLKFVQYLVILN